MKRIIPKLEPAAAVAPAERSTATVCARKLSAGRRTPIAADELVAALRADEVPAPHHAHVFGFFEELPIDSVHEVTLEEGPDFVHLAKLAGRLGAEGKTAEWIEDMADDGVAPAA